jgi:hypothetical protein
MSETVANFDGEGERRDGEREHRLRPGVRGK